MIRVFLLFLLVGSRDRPILRLFILLIFDAAIFVVCVSFWHRDLVLIWTGQTTQADVVKVEPWKWHAPWRARERHMFKRWRVHYQYRDHLGQLHSDEDAVYYYPDHLDRIPRNGPPRQTQVTFSTLAPSVSRLSDRVAWLPLLGVLLTVPIFGWLVYLIVVKSRESRLSSEESPPSA